MFWKPQYGTCLSCGNRKLLVVKRGYCEYCNEFKVKGKSKKPLLKRTPIKPKNRNAKANNDFYREAWGEWEKSGKINCMECNAELKCFSPKFVAHVLSRGSYDVDWLKYSMENVIPLCSNCHDMLDHGKDCTKMKIWPWVKEKRQELKRRYYANF